MLWATIVITRAGPQNPGMAMFDTPSVAVQFCASLLCAVVFYLYEKEPRGNTRKPKDKYSNMAD